MDFILKGNNFSVFMYGQTCSGKTHTMKGNQKDVQSRKPSLKQIKSENQDFLGVEKKDLSSKSTFSKNGPLTEMDSGLNQEEGIIQMTLRRLFLEIEQ